MWWLAIPAVAAVATVVYEAVTDSSSSSSSSYSDNSQEKAREAQERASEQAKAAREQRLHEKTELLVSRSLSEIRRSFLNPTSFPTRFKRQDLQSFYDSDIDSLSEATAAISALVGKQIQLKERPSNRTQIQNELANLTLLKKLIKDL